MEMNNSDLGSLAKAKFVLENPDFMGRVIETIGKPLESAMGKLPENYREKIDGAVQKALMGCFNVARGTMDLNDKEPKKGWHKFLATATGIVGGAFGFTGFIVELPLSTTIMMRSILAIANSHGECLTDPCVSLECLQVLALGGNSDNGESNGNASRYFARRYALAAEMKLATQYLAGNTIIDETAPVIIRFIARIAAYFGVDVTTEAAAMAVPLVGAAGGGAINYLFTNQFQKMADAHFTVRRLERKYGEDYIAGNYAEINGER